MESVCQYSTSVFVANFVVILLLSVFTDYWYYVSYDREQIVRALTKVYPGYGPLARIVHANDTDDYLTVVPYDCRHRWRSAEGTTRYQYVLGDDASTVKFRHQHLEWEEEEETAVSPSVSTPTSGAEWRTVSRTLWACSERTDVNYVLFPKYGNLFKECDDIPEMLRNRIRQWMAHPQKCVNILYRASPPYYTSIITHLEKGAFACAILSIILMLSSLITGVIGHLLNHITTLLVATLMPICAGLFLLSSLALFHSKLYVLRRHSGEINHSATGHMHSMDDLINNPSEIDPVPFISDYIQRHLVYEVGWSLILSWGSVLLCFLSAYLWMNRFKDIRLRVMGGRHCYYQHDYPQEDVGVGERSGRHCGDALANWLRRTRPGSSRYHHYLIAPTTSPDASPRQPHPHPPPSHKHLSKVRLLLQKFNDKRGYWYHNMIDRCGDDSDGLQENHDDFVRIYRNHCQGHANQLL